MMLPALVAIGRIAATGAARAVAVSGAALGRAVGVAGARILVAARSIGVSGRALFTGKPGKAVIRVNARKALRKLDRFEQIIQEVTEDALPIMKKNTAKITGTARKGTKYNKQKNQLYNDVEYSKYLDRPNFQKSNVGLEARRLGITKPTKKWIEKEILRRVKKELGR